MATVKVRKTTPVRVPRRRGVTRISSKNQVTLPVSALRRSGLKAGAEIMVEDASPGRIVLARADDPVQRLKGMFTGLYPKGYLKKLRGEWRY
jgi:bifunctional DNA-binding transcriptional regulator/antitoxin component of YhaV-PrlF toxin-antitoxin module